MTIETYELTKEENFWNSPKPPEFAVISLRRLHGLHVPKNTTPVKVPIIINLLKYIWEPSPPHKKIIDPKWTYVCNAFLVHTGNFGGGHFTGYIQSENRVWYCLDDSIRTRVSVKQVKQEMLQGYMYFYQYVMAAD